MQKHYIKTERTARFFTQGQLNSNTRKIYFLLHGYAQNADEFLTSFQELAHDDVFLVAPEGLSHFYWKELFGNPVSSWMTSLEREREIEDYVLYLQQLYQSILHDFDLSNIVINYVGFSQGCPTLTRWLERSSGIKINHVVLYAGELASEIDLSSTHSFVRKCTLHFVYGEEDRLIRKERIEEFSNHLRKENVIFKLCKTSGRHAITNEGVVYIKQNT
jgi:predicted esterase